MRKLIALFNEYESKENAMHVFRSMKENARQGFWNGQRLHSQPREARRKKTKSIQSKPKRCSSFSSHIFSATAVRARCATSTRNFPTMTRSSADTGLLKMK